MHPRHVRHRPSVNIVLLGNDDPGVLGHEVVHTLQYREMSFLDLLFDSGAFGQELEEGGVKIGQDVGVLALQPPGLLLKHDDRPVEFVPMALQLGR